MDVSIKNLNLSMFKNAFTLKNCRNRQALRTTPPNPSWLDAENFALKLTSGYRFANFIPKFLQAIDRTPEPRWQVTTSLEEVQRLVGIFKGC